ncbi:MAG TPA: HlyD family efflux transporter periplasmic adaptor subunit [Trichormus sp. M33_DOE_039]|nr:HlyD family efflux transporter periplasmic adaptor subunit [Trichormus sp. M33_DOE_039]
MVREPQPSRIRSVKSDEFLPPIAIWARLGALVIMGGCSLAIVMAAITKYNITVKAMATVRPTGEIRIVQAAVEGTIQKIQVIENQVVKQGDIIAHIDDSAQQTQEKQLKDKIYQGKQQIIQIDQQVRALKAQINAETLYLQQTIASVEADLSYQQRDYQNRQIITQTELQEAQASLELAKDERDRYQKAVEAGIVSQLQYSEKQQALKVAEARLQRSKAALRPSNANVTIAKQRIAQETAKAESLLASLNREQKALLQRRVELTSQITQSQQDLQQVKLVQTKSILRSSVDGVIFKLNLRNPGQVVRVGDTVAQITPSNHTLIIKAFVAAQDITKVAVGQNAQLRVSAYPYPDYGVMTGTVIAIAPDATYPQMNVGNSHQNFANAGQGSLNNTANGYYEVTIQPHKPYFLKTADSVLSTTKHLYPLQAGMEGNVDIISQEDTVLKFILRKMRLLTDI